MSTTSKPVSPTADPVRRAPTDDTVVRWLPLAGVGFAVMQAWGNLTIDKFPDENTSPSALVGYYANHHGQVQRGGEILAFSGLFLALFVAGLVVRCRHNFGTAAVIAVGGAGMLAAEVASGSTYALLGTIGTEHGIDPAALQAWHVAGAAFGIGVASMVLLLGVALGGILADAIPTWIGWTALVLAAAHLTPFGFFASLLLLPWALVVGIVLTVRRPATD
jgi:MFS family permease